MLVYFLFAAIVIVILLAVGWYYYVRKSTPVSAVIVPATAPVVTTGPVVSEPRPATSPTTSPKPVTSAGPAYLGCYKDTTSRALANQASGEKTFSECANLARMAGALYFGMQYAQGSPPGSGRAQCWIGSTDYKKYGEADTCTARDQSGNALGGSWSNAVYRSQI